MGPANQDGDKEGCTYNDGIVKVPASFHQCWKVMAENSWISLSGNPQFGGQVYQDWIQGIMDFTEKHKGDPDFAKDVELLLKAVQDTNDFPTRYMEYFGGEKIRLVGLTATRFLDCFSEVLMAHLMLEQGLLAREKLKDVQPESADGIFYRGKIETVKFFCRNILPNVFARHITLELEDTSAVDIPVEAF